MARVKLEAESGQIRRAQQDLDNLNNSGQRTDKTVQTLRRSFIALGGAAALGAAIKRTADFSQAIADLSAITGAAGADLDFYREKAAEIGRTTSLSASQAAEAFKLIASAQPDLLSSSEALAAVTQEAVTLAEATGMTLPAAATALGGAINQFQLSANQANEVINVLAASSQRGTVEVESITESLVNAGAAANALGLDLPETVAGLQALARANITGARAGTALNQVLLGLERTNDSDLMPSVNGLVDALDNLAERQLSNNEIIKQFGREALPAVQALLAQRDAARTLNEEIRGTNTAAEQASTRMDTLTGDIKQLQSALEGLAIGVFGQDIEDLNRSLTQAATGGVNNLTENLDVLSNIATGVATIIGVRVVLALRAKTLATAESVREDLKAAAAANATTTSYLTKGAAATRVTGQMVAMTTATRAATGAIALIGGPAGAAILAATAIATFTSRSIEARNELAQGSLNEEIQRLKDNFEDMTNAGRASTLNRLTNEQLDLNQELRTARERHEELKQAADDATRSGSEFSGAGAQARLSQQAGRVAEIEAALKGVEEQQTTLVKLGMPDGWKSLDEGASEVNETLERSSENFREVADPIALQILELNAGAEAAEKYRIMQELGTDATAEEIQQVNDLIRIRKEAREELEAEEEARRAAAEAQREQDRINSEAQGIVASLQSEEEQIRASYKRRAQIVMDSTIYTEEERRQVLLDLQNQTNDELGELNKGYWESWLDAADENLTDFSEISGNAIENFSRSFGEAFASATLEGESATDAIQGMMAGLARSTIAALGEMAAQWLAYQAVQLFVGKSTQAGAAGAKSAEAAAASTMAGLNAFASTAAIPVVGPALAPGAAAAAISATAPMATTVSALMAGSVAARRNGGSFMGGQDLLVGEEGPERIRMPGPGRVTPYNDLMREAKGGDDNRSATNEINLSFTVQAIDTQGMEEALANQRDTIFNLVASALREQGREL